MRESFAEFVAEVHDIDGIPEVPESLLKGLYKDGFESKDVMLMAGITALVTSGIIIIEDDDGFGFSAPTEMPVGEAMAALALIETMAELIGHEALRDAFKTVKSAAAKIDALTEDERTKIKADLEAGREPCVANVSVDGLWDCQCSECVSLQREATADAN